MPTPSSIGSFVTEDDAAAYHAVGYWSATETLPTRLRRHAVERASHLAVVDDLGNQLTYAQLHEQSDKLAAALAARGTGPGDVVGVQLPNRVEAVVAPAAVEKLGAIVCPMVPAYRERELAHNIAKTSMKVLFEPGQYRGFDHDALSRKLLADHESLHTVVTLTPCAREPSFVSFDNIVERGDPTGFAWPELDPDAVSAVLFTSGTEAEPKGTLHTHNTLLANVRTLEIDLAMGPDDGVFMASPLGHGTGYGFGTRLAGYLGSTLSLLGIWHPARAARMLAEFGAAYTHGATPFVLDLLGLPDIKEHDFSRLRYFVTGGATVPPNTATRVDELLGCKLLRLYGQTEGFMITLSRAGDAPATVELSDGYPARGVEVRALDDGGKPAARGVPGICYYRGPHRCVGFLDDPARETVSYTDGWFRSGDLVSIAENGAVTVVGRTKEVINRGGYKYSPREIEDVLAGHPDVERVAVVRMDDPRLVDRACAFVVPRPAREPTLDGLTTYLEAHGVASFKWPERLEVVAEFPMTASGKVRKVELEQWLRSDGSESRTGE